MQLIPLKFHVLYCHVQASCFYLENHYCPDLKPQVGKMPPKGEKCSFFSEDDVSCRGVSLTGKSIFALSCCFTSLRDQEDLSGGEMFPELSWDWGYPGLGKVWGAAAAHLLLVPVSDWEQSTRTAASCSLPFLDWFGMGGREAAITTSCLFPKSEPSGFGKWAGGFAPLLTPLCFWRLGEEQSRGGWSLPVGGEAWPCPGSHSLLL